MKFFLLFNFLIIPPEYHTFEELQNILDSIVPLYKDFAKMETLNYTEVDSNPIICVKISDNVRYDEIEPPVLFVALHHAEEPLGLEICIELIKRLLKFYGEDQNITKFVNECEIYIIPCLNPDGYSVVTEGICEIWRKNKRDNNQNKIFDYRCGKEGRGDGVDLNRNYDYLWSNAGSPYDTSEYYRGPYPFSEPETRSIKSLCERENFVVGITYHSARTGLGEVIYYPWRDGAKLCPDFIFIKEVADSLALNIKSDITGEPYIPIVTSRRLGGVFRNWIYTNYGTFGILIEVSDTTLPAPHRVSKIVEYNLNGVYYILRRVLYNIVKVTVRDSITGAHLSASCRILQIDTIPEIKHISTDENGDIFRILKPGNYTLEVEKEGYRKKSINFTLNDREYKEINVYLYPFVYDTFSQSIYVLKNLTKDNVVLVFWVKEKKDSPEFCLYDNLGRKIKKIIFKDLFPGFYRKEISLNLKRGTYLLIFKTRDHKKKEKIILLK
ncbi:MAG: M14 family zinc carboxypeptidase [Candidatus Hydrothermales bacterium]